MKKIGLISGLGPEATVDYYNAIINSFKEENKGTLNYPEIIIYSVNMEHFIGKIKADDYPAGIDYLATAIHSLERAGADFISISANTPHLFFDEIQKRVNIPMISIVEATAREAKKQGIKRAGLLGTGFTMNSNFYTEVFEKFGIEIIVPNTEDKEYINQKLFTEIELGIFKDETREGLEEIIAKMKRKEEIDAIILGCTEFPLILKENTYHGVVALNTTQIHVDEIVAWSRKA